MTMPPIWENHHMKKTPRSVTRSSGNIFADLGLPNADEHMLKARVAIFIGKRIDQLALTQQGAAKRMGLSQPDVSNLLRGHFEGFSLERLLGCVRALGNDVEIKVKRPSRDDDREGRMSLMMA
jgi:predicted XRE-type DNA-binding protein